MAEDKDIKDAISILSNDTKKWLDIKSFLEEEIRSIQSVIQSIDKIVKDREEKFSKLN